ncbi:hypothetical protein DSO57_1026677 [Entomophthora muscae]|uniref:Uncharacterized protein n=1 Tax=Entomophthora muscae TaxID=34485 RepID=A0ACC2TP67_9FUNG|nr:hypothetical protein DSO57_1026677 [Entomophthora muscae]
MNHLIFTAELTACLGIGGYQPGSEFFGASPDGLVHDPHYNPGQMNSSQTGPWPPLVSPHLTLSIEMYTSMYYILTYFARSFRRYNIHAKVFRWLMTVYLIVTALTGLQFTNLLPYILQVVPTVTGYYTRRYWCPKKLFLQVLYSELGNTFTTENQYLAKVINTQNTMLHWVDTIERRITKLVPVHVVQTPTHQGVNAI